MAIDNKTTVGAVVGLVGVISALSLIPRWIARPTSGPRLLPGEIRASAATAQASRAYWRAEEAAGQGDCKIADRAFKVGEYFRLQAEERARRGDQTGGNLKPAVRNARDEIRKCGK